MNAEHVDLIDKNMDKLVDMTRNLQEIVNKLQEKKILNHYMAKYIFEDPDQRKQKLEFYRMIKCRGPKAFSNLVLTLRETQNIKVEEILSTLKVSRLFLEQPIVVKNPRDSPIAEECDRIDFCTVDDLVVEVHPDRILMDLEESSPCESETYKMRSKPRGLALVINIFKARDHDDRRGSRLDAEKINNLFTQIGYDVICRSDLTKKEFKNEIKKFSMNKDLMKVDSLVVFVMSHGRQYKDTEDVELVATDGLRLRTSWIISQFSEDNPKFVSFIDKPKLFFFQACRVIPKNPPCEIEKRDESPQKHCKFTNTWITYSTCTGSPSMRDVVEGAWFVGEFCNVVAKQAWKHDLDVMLSAVEKKISEKKDKCWGEQHMEIKKRGIKGKIYFNPGL